MADSVNVFPAGMRLTDADTGAPIEGATIEFYDAGTTSPKTVYSNANLTVESEIGTSVITDSLGYPTVSGSKTLIYVGTAPYKIVIKDANGVQIATHDYVKGAVASVDLNALSVNAFFNVVTKTTNYSVVKADQNKIIPANCTSGSFTVTLPSAVDVGNGWGVTIQHAGSANKVTVATISSQLITSGNTSLGTSTDLRFNEEQIRFVSDGGNWIASPRIQLFVPAGTIMMHAANAAPLGWLSCNGAAISRTTYAALFATISTTYGVGDGSTTFNLPDLRGEFVRGWDNSRGIDTGRAFGSFQNVQTNNIQDFQTSGVAGDVPKTQTVDDLGNYSGYAETGTNDSGNGTAIRMRHKGVETRPRNVALLYIIKY